MILNALVIEQENEAADCIVQNLRLLDRNIRVKARLRTVREGLHYFSYNPSPDLIFSGVQLSDGLSFEIFNQATVQAPVIFIAGYDDFVMSAFEHNGIDYLLKPVDKNRLQKAVERYRKMKDHFSNKFIAQNNVIKGVSLLKERLLVKSGRESLLLSLSDIVLFSTSAKISYAIDREGHRYITDSSLSEWQSRLDKSLFFRANRQYIVNIDFIRGYVSFDKVKLKLLLAAPQIEDKVVISQEMAPLFRSWIQGA